MKHFITLLCVTLIGLLPGCKTPPASVSQTSQAIADELQRARALNALQKNADRAPVPTTAAAPENVAPVPQRVERRFNLAVSQANAAQVFAAIGAETKQNMVVHPEVTGQLTLNLREVTLREALDTIREVYGYDWRESGNRIVIQPAALQTRIFQLNYLSSSRSGRSDTRITSGSIVSNSGPGGAGAAQSGSGTLDGTVVSTQGSTDLWTEVAASLRAIVGSSEGSSVVLSPQSGTIVVRAMPRELREVEQYLRMSRLALERQVMIEAKIVDVQLNEGFQSGINWMAMADNRAQRISTGADARQIIVPSGNVGNAGDIGQVYNQDAGAFVPNTLGNVLASPIVGSIGGRIADSPLSGVLGLAFTTSSFSAILSFLETQGTTHVLSSPRIATLNNQKAVLKVGSDDFFVTNITTTTTTTAGGSVSSPTINLQPFFSGISLDVTPQIDEHDNVMLHIRPSVSVVTERAKQINLGTSGVFSLPLASSRTNETDSIVRVREGHIVAIGGLMDQAQTTDGAKVPGLGDVPLLDKLFGQKRDALQKRELVVLLRATVLRDERDWNKGLADAIGRLDRIDGRDTINTVTVGTQAVPTPAPAAQPAPTSDITPKPTPAASSKRTRRSQRP
jgi:MSHA biogenesis protein MshL